MKWIPRGADNLYSDALGGSVEHRNGSYRWSLFSISCGITHELAHGEAEYPEQAQKACDEAAFAGRHGWMKTFLEAGRRRYEKDVVGFVEAPVGGLIETRWRWHLRVGRSPMHPGYAVSEDAAKKACDEEARTVWGAT